MNKYIYLGDNKITAYQTDHFGEPIYHTGNFIEVSGEHKWEKYQILEEGKQFEFKHFYSVLVAVPIEALKPSPVVQTDRLYTEEDMNKRALDLLEFMLKKGFEADGNGEYWIREVNEKGKKNEYKFYTSKKVIDWFKNGH